MREKLRVWVVDDDRSIRWVLERALQQAGIEVATFENGESALNKLQLRRPDVLVTDIRMPGVNGLDLLANVRDDYPDLPVIIMTAHSDLESALAAYQGGAFEYLPKPFDVDEAVDLVRRAGDQKRQANLASLPEAPRTRTEIIGAAPAMQEVFRAIGRLSRSNITVLINGESGTGKELVASSLHRHSPRSGKPFIAINTAAIPRELLESELFGHERGAFTGAQTLRRGRFEQANGGSLFLDEIGDMPPDLQTRLLRVLATGEFYRVGGHEPIKVDVRIIAATHQNLEQLVNDGKFREDLFHRLNVIRIHIPSLRERREDVPILAKHFLAEAAKELKVEPKRLRSDTEQLLTTLEWPGNVRQLENFCRWLTVMAPGAEILPEDLPPELREIRKPTKAADDWIASLTNWAETMLKQGNSALMDISTPQYESALILAALNFTNGRRQEAARLLGLGRNTLTRKIKELALAVSVDDDFAEEEMGQ